jgi:hypothetical protein
MTGPANIQIHIDELVLHGFDPRDRHAIGDAVQAELTRLMAVSPPDVTGRVDRAQIDAGRYESPAEGSGAAAVGRAAAGALHRSLI